MTVLARDFLLENVDVPRTSPPPHSETMTAPLRYILHRSFPVDCFLPGGFCFYSMDFEPIWRRSATQTQQDKGRGEGPETTAHGACCAVTVQ